MVAHSSGASRGREDRTDNVLKNRTSVFATNNAPCRRRAFDALSLSFNAAGLRPRRQRVERVRRRPRLRVRRRRPRARSVRDSVGAGRVVHFNSDDLEHGNAAKGLEVGVGGSVQGDWRLDVETDWRFGCSPSSATATDSSPPCTTCCRETPTGGLWRTPSTPDAI